MRYRFSPMFGICLWSSNAEAVAKFDYGVDSSTLPVPENTWRRMLYLSAWWDTSIDWNYPPDPSPWDDEERRRFNVEAQKMLALLREQLGADFEIVDESKTAEL